MAAFGYLAAAFAVEPHGNVAAFARKRHALGIGTQRDPFALQDGENFRRHVVILARQHFRRALDDRNLRTEATVHLGELEADVASAHDDEMPRREVHRHDAAVVEERHVLHAAQAGDRSTRADVEEHALGLQRTAVHLHATRTDEPRMALDERYVAHAAEPFLQSIDGVAHPAVLAALDPCHDDARLVGSKTVLASPARHVRGARTRDHRLRRDAACVDARATEDVALDQRRLQPFLVQPRAERGPGLPGADDDGVESFAHACLLKTSRRLLAGIALSSASTRPCRAASATIASASRRPLAGSRARSIASKRAWLSEVCLPP